MITLTFPNNATFEATSVNSVELPSPQLGDVAKLSNTAKRNRSMNGTQWITKRLVNQTLRFNFSNVARKDVKRFESLLKVNKGENIALTGYGTGSLTIKLLESMSTTDDTRNYWTKFPVPDDPPFCENSDGASFSLNVELIG